MTPLERLAEEESKGTVGEGAEAMTISRLRARIKARFGMEWYDNAYVEEAICSNCDEKDFFFIRMGLTKKQVEKELPKCEMCGCKTMGW